MYKPQGISAVKNIKWDNVPYENIVGHDNVNTGASRYFQVVGTYILFWPQLEMNALLK